MGEIEDEEGGGIEEGGGDCVGEVVVGEGEAF